MKRLAVVSLVLLLTSRGWALDSRPASDPRSIAATKLVYLSGNYMHGEEVDRCVKTMRAAVAAGYTGVVVTDCKFEPLG